MSSESFQESLPDPTKSTILSEEDELRRQLAELAAQRVALEKAKADRDTRDALRQQVEEERQRVARALAVEKAEAELGKVDIDYTVIDTPRGCIIVKRPNHLKYRQYQDAGQFSSLAQEKLVRPCLYHPSSDAFDQVIEEFPGVLLRVANAVTELATGRRKETEGKF